MSIQGQHAADDGSLARSTGGAAARGAMLIALALIIGLLLMAFALDDPATDLSSAGADDVATSEGTEDAPDDGVAGDTGSEGAVNAVEPTEDDSATPDPATIENDTPTETIPEQVVQPATPGEVRPPSEVNVLVANGTGGKGVAGAVSDKLKAAAYIASVSNAPSTAQAVIYYKPGYDGDARAVADTLGAPPDIIKPAPEGTIGVASEAISDGRLDAAHVVVIIGADGNVPTS